MNQESAIKVLNGKKGRIRFSKAPWFSEVNGRHATIVGAGGIGSWLAHFCARSGMYLHVWDMDAYDVNNMGGQLAQASDLNTNKATALAHFVNKMLGPVEKPHIHPIEDPFDDESDALPVTFAAVDDMEARKILYQQWLELGDDRELFIDGRMGAEQFEIYTATKTSDDYMDHWFPPEDAATLPCAYRATSHIGSMVASVMFSVMTNHFTEDNFVPSVLTYNAQLFMLEAP